MKYVVLTITTLLYAFAGAAIAFGVTQLARATARVSAYESAIAEPVNQPGDPYDDYFGEGMCWERYAYRVADQTYLGPPGCSSTAANGRIRVLYKRSNPGESILDDISTLIGSGIRWVAFGAVLGFWASLWRARSVALHGRAPSVGQWGSGAWGLIALLGFTAAAARDIADVREGFCGSRRAVLSGSIARFVSDHERRFPRDWLEAFQANVDKDGVLTGSPECLAATQLDELVRVCSGGFHIIADADIGSPICDLSGRSHYKVDIEFQTDRKYQTVNVRFPEAP